MSSEARPTLLVFADSLAYYGPKGGLPSDDPRILLIPADHVGHQRLETLMNKNAMTLELPPTSRRCVGHLTVVK